VGHIVEAGDRVSHVQLIAQNVSCSWRSAMTIDYKKAELLYNTAKTSTAIIHL